MKFKITLYKEGNELYKFSLYSFAHDERAAIEKLLSNYPNFKKYIIDKIERLK